jgi:amidohydrolase
LNPEQIKEKACSFIDANEVRIREFSLDIFSYPELGFKETYASKRLAEELAEAGYEVKSGVAGLETALRADLVGGPGPRVALVAEYDALDLRLPDGSHRVCHACGHNLNVGAALGAAMALAAVKGSLGGSVSFLGTPFEEGGGGKVIMLEGRAFEGVDAAVALHGDQRDWFTVARACTSTRNFLVRFTGRRPASISSRSYVDPNDALSFFLLSLDIVERGITSDTRVQRKVVGNVESPNVHALDSSVELWLRSGDDDYLDGLVRRIREVAAGCAAAVGAEFRMDPQDVPYRRIVQSPVMEELARSNVEFIGKKFTPDEPSPYPFGTDMGNVSQAIPSAQLLFGIPGGFNFHTEAAVEQSRSEDALRSMIDGSKVMACMAVDLLSDPSKVKRAADELAASRANGFKGLPTWHTSQ